MQLTLKSFNGHAINDGNSYRAADIDPWDTPDASPSFLDRARTDTIYSGTYTVTTRNVPLVIRILDYPNRYQLAEQLRIWLKRGETGDLVFTFNDTGVDYALPCVVVSLTQDAKYPYIYTAVLRSQSTNYRAVNPETDTWNITSSPATKAITVSGSDTCYLSASLTMRSVPSSGWLYTRIYQLSNGASSTYQQPWCITMDTAALVTAGKMQADCDDLRVVIDGVQVPRWIESPNNAATKIWINVNLAPKYTLALRTALAATGDITLMKFAQTADAKATIAAMPGSGVIAHDGEYFTYSSKDGVESNLVITGRGAYGTTKASHSIGDTMTMIPQVIQVLYGYSSATDPALTDALYDDTKPIIDLANSTNASWVWGGTNGFTDTVNPGRPGSWKFAVARRGDKTEAYMVTHDGTTGAYVMGAALRNWIMAGRKQGEKGNISWTFTHPCGINTVTGSGEKFRYGGDWPNEAGLQYYLDVNKKKKPAWKTLYSISSPGSVSSWGSWSHTSTSVGGYKQIRYYNGDSLTSYLNGESLIEVQSVAVAFTSANLPSGSWLSEQSNNRMIATLRNDTTGQGVLIDYPVSIDIPLVIDAENLTATYSNQSALPGIQLDTVRDAWLELAPGDNDLTIASDGVTELDIDLSWYPRRI